MTTPAFGGIALEYARRYVPLELARSEFEQRRASLMTRLVAAAREACLGDGGPPQEKWGEGGAGGPMVGLYFSGERSKYAELAVRQGSRGRLAGFWLGFMPMDRYSSDTHSEAAGIGFRADLWFPLVHGRERELLAAAKELARSGAPDVEGTYVYIPIEKVDALDVAEEQLLGIATGLWRAFAEADARLAAVL